mgnify:CR=1 FL=1
MVANMNSNSTAGRGVAAGRRRGRQFRRGLGLGRETLARLGTERRGAVALIVALVLPVLLGVVALALEVGSWATARIDVQRQADIAAMTAAVQYANGAPSATSIALQSTLSNASIAAGTSLAAVNGVTAANNASLVLVQVAGVKTTPDTNVAFRAVVSRQMSLGIGKVLSTLPSVTISSTAIAEITGSVSGGGQPCVFSLDKTSTGTGVSVTGNSHVTASGCTVRSNNGIKILGSSSITADAIYAQEATQPYTFETLQPILDNSSYVASSDGTESLCGAAPPDTGCSGSSKGGKAWPLAGPYSGWGTVTDPKSSLYGITDPLGANPYPLLFNLASSTISDPYANDSTMATLASNLTTYTQSATQPATSSGIYPSYNVTNGWTNDGGTVSAGSYPFVYVSNGMNLKMDSGTYYIAGNFDITGGSTVTLSPGTYYVGGNVSVDGGTTLTGTGVTFVVGGSVYLGGGANISLTAPTEGASYGTAGVLFYTNASTSKSNVSLSDYSKTYIYNEKSYTDKYKMNDYNSISNSSYSSSCSGTYTFCISNGVGPDLTGAIYTPNGLASFQGGTHSTNDCLQTIANSVVFAGGSSYAGNFSSSKCTNYATKTFPSVTGTATAALVR